MILYNKYKTAKSWNRSSNVENSIFSKVCDIICYKKHLLYVGKKYTYYKYTRNHMFPYYINSTYYGYKDKINDILLNENFKKHMRIKTGYVFSKEILKSSYIRKRIVFDIPIGTKNIFINVVENNIRYIEFIHYRDNNISFICVKNPVMTHKCGYIKNKKMAKKMLREILRYNDKYDMKLKILLLNYLGWIPDYYGRDANRLLQQYIKINIDIKSYYRYIVISSYKNIYDDKLVSIIITYFKKYIISSGINKFMDDIVMKRIKLYDSEQHIRILKKYIYNNEVFDNMILIIYPDAKSQVLKYLLENKKKLELEMNAVIEKNKNLIHNNEFNIYTNQYVDLQSAMNNYDKKLDKYTSVTDKYIRRIKIYRVHLRVFIQSLLT